jgi:glycosyltransferase involved in cell wall biosynthesis
MEMYRGVEDLIKALAGIRKTVPELKLAAGGAERPATVPYFNRLKRMARELGQEGAVVWLGKLSDPEMSWCYNNCSALAIASRLESFGFVAVEALAHGCNCVSTDSPCLPEIFKDCAVYYPAGDIAALERNLLEVLKRSPEERARFKKMSVERSGQFSWDEAAAQTFSVLEKVFKERTDVSAGR